MAGVAILVGLACQPVSSVEHTGGLNEPCREDGTCDRGLICVSYRCEPDYSYGDPGAGDPYQPADPGPDGIVPADPNGPGDGAGDAPGPGDPGTAAQCTGPQGERPVQWPATGELVITEVYANPDGADDNRDWLEVFVAAAAPVDLNGLRIENENLTPTQRDWLISDSACVTVSPGAHVVLGGANVVDDGVTATATLQGAADTLLFGTPSRLAIWANDTKLDEMDYPTAVSGKSWSLAGGILDAQANNLAENWCEATVPHPPFVGIGSPGLANDPCGAVCRDNGNWRAVQSPAVNELVITEVYADPAGSDDNRDWLEVYVAAPSAVDVNGLVVENENLTPSLRTWVLDSLDCISVAPESYVLIGGTNTAVDSVTMDATISGVSSTLLFNSTSRLTLKADGLTVDEVSYGDPVSGTSSTLNAGLLDAIQNDNTGNWCPAPLTHPPFTGTGSPGQANDPCP